jgi:hypothetical protein
MHHAFKLLVGTGTALLLGAACGGSSSSSSSGNPVETDASVDSGSGSTDGGGGVDSGGGADSGSDGGSSVAACPVSYPNAGDACPKEGRKCQYGDNPKCLGIAECMNGKWSVAIPRCAPPDATCPATREIAAGQACGKLDAYCNYAGLTCSCTNCTNGPVQNCTGPTTWHCDAPNTTQGCPAARPNLGTACVKEALFCNYGCEANESRQCTGGAWEAASQPNGCPKSTREAKDRIHYLDNAERAKLAEAALALKLSRWHYKEPALASRERLGYILEDAPGAPSSDMDQKQVDLYAYTSMVLALAQDQAREIKALRAEVDALKKRDAAKR